jgi:hypothetical protein
MDTNVKQLTLDDFPSRFLSLKRLIMDHCGGDQERMWEMYFNGGFDEQVRYGFEHAVDPQAMTTAMMLRGFLKTLRQELKRATV